MYLFHFQVCIGEFVSVPELKNNPLVISAKKAYHKQLSVDEITLAKVKNGTGKTRAHSIPILERKLRTIFVIPFLSQRVVEMTFVTCLTSTQSNVLEANSPQFEIGMRRMIRL